ncbi:uncharacterized protein LOC120074723 [Benincasa hispida]|uniref:uncharacterized protein LOC120074723 n=1 Tax=Benincasa hispida TaxID=102211 RepID=UPI00190214FE|nr:uncharacterized protein LOC120074723 [Benincasa hispida]
MEAFLQGQDLWDLVSSDDSIPKYTLENAETRRKWKVQCDKTLFALRTSIRKEYIKHVYDREFSKESWDTLERLFTQKNTTRLQYLENKLARTTRGWVNQPSIVELENLLSNLEALMKQMLGNNKKSHPKGSPRENCRDVLGAASWETSNLIVG